MNGATVSVVLPIYNGAAVVSDAIQSIILQSYTDWELIIIDDGSTDDSLLIAEEYESSDPRIKVYQNPLNLGLAATMNRGVEIAAGDYIAVQEQDDMSVPSRLAKEVQILDAMPAVSLVSGIAEWLDDELQPTNYFPGILAHGGQYPWSHAQLFEYLYIEQCKIVNAGCMFRRSILEAWPKPFNELAKMSIDWEFFLRLARTHHVWGINEVVVRMRRGRAHHSLTKQKELQFREARRCINEVYRDYKTATHIPVSRKLRRKAFSAELVIEARYWSYIDRVRSVALLMYAFVLDPSNAQIWRTSQWITRRALARFTS